MADTSNVEILPIWNNRASAADRLRELAVMADKHPGRFERVVIGYQGNDPDTGRYLISYAFANCNTIELLGLLDLVRNEVVKVTTHG